MILKQKPRHGDRSTLVASFCAPLIAIVLASCSNLNHNPGIETGVADAIATPVRTADITQIESSQAGDAIQQQDSAGFHGPVNIATRDTNSFESPDYFDFDQPSVILLDLEVELEAEQAELLREQQLREEAEVENAIKVALQETRRKNNAWYRLQQGMQLEAVDNARVTAQLKWFLDHPGYLQRVMERARPILPSLHH